MTPSARRSALAALGSARAAIARLDTSRDAEDLAADLIEGWSTVETALRSLVGGSALSGQALIRDARQKQLISFADGNALAEFHAARERLDRPDYRPNESDVSAARAAFIGLEAGLSAEGPPPEAPAAEVVAPVTNARPSDPSGLRVPTDTVVSERSRRALPKWAILAVSIVGVLILAGISYYYFYPHANDALAQGVKYYRSGQREAAVGEFNRAIREDPKDALPHVYLSRMAREVGNMSLAFQEVQLAVQAEPEDPVAQREMGAYLLSVGNYELARRFFVRAVEGNPDDPSAQGWLGCTLVKLGRVEEGVRFLNRAGQGDWSVCAPAPVQGLGYGTAQPPPNP